ncbi:MAG: hypothetical protein QG597_2181 [Actinomycetota bacterium]|nr:hypothetical protein [Actinomycetota bacterium]
MVIASSRDVVWALLTDAARYPSWNPTIAGIEGSIVAGAQISVSSADDPDHRRRVTVVDFEPENHMTWRADRAMGLFTSERVFLLGDCGSGVRFELAEDFGGPLAAILGRRVPDRQSMFEDFAQALRAAAESYSTTG